VGCLWGGCILLTLTAACSDESFTPDECQELVQYEIRNAQRMGGAVQPSGIIGDSPLTPEEQRELQKLADKGCVTLPAKQYSLKDPVSDKDGG